VKKLASNGHDSISGENAYGLLAGRNRRSSARSNLPLRSGGTAAHFVASVFVIQKLTTATRSTSVLRLRVDTFRSGGKGGQNVNKVETAVRINPSSTNIVVACQAAAQPRQESRYAMKMLRSRLYDLEIQKRQEPHDKLDESKLDISFGSQSAPTSCSPTA